MKTTPAIRIPRARAMGAGLVALALSTSAMATQYPPGPGNCCPDTLTIINVQNPLAVPHPVTSNMVLGVGGIITGFDAKPSGYAFYIQMSNGLRWSGVGIYTGKTNEGPGTAFNLQRGDSVVVYGKIQELQGGTGISGEQADDTVLAPTENDPDHGPLLVRRVSQGNPIPGFHVGTVSELSEPSTNPAAEQWEGMLVRLVGPLKVARTSVSGGCGTDNSFLVVDLGCTGPHCDSVFVDGNTLTTFAPPPVGTILGAVQGIFDQRARGYRIQLRDANDVETVVPPVAVDAFPIYDNNLSGSDRLDSIMVVFDHPVNKNSAENIGNYSLASGGTIDGALRLDAPDDNRVVLEIRNSLSDGANEAITVGAVAGMTGPAPVASAMATGATQTALLVLPFVNGVLDLKTVQSPDPAALVGNACEDRSRFAGVGSAPGRRLTVEGIATASLGGFCTLQDGADIRSGLTVLSPVAPVVEGQRYLLTCSVRELLGETQGTNNSYVHSLGTSPEPPVALQSVHVLTDITCDFGQLFLTGEDYEGMLVRVQQAVITGSAPAGASFFVAIPGDASDQIQVVTQSGSFVFTPNAGEIATVTGVLRQTDTGFAIYPRSDSDIQGFGAAPTLSVPLDASKAATQSQDPDIVLDQVGNLFMVWARNFHQSVHSLSHDHGENWSSFGSIPRQGVQPAVAVADSNKICVLTAGLDSLLFHQSRDGGFQMDPVVSTVDPFPTLYPAIIEGSAGHLHAAWERYQAGIFAGRSFSGGASFDTPVAIALDSLPLTHHSMARIGATRGDSVYVFWQYERVGEPNIDRVLFSRSLDGGATFSAPRAVVDSKNPLTSTVKLAFLGDAHVGADGTLYVLGMDGFSGRAAFLRSTDGGIQFTLVGYPTLPDASNFCPKSFIVGAGGVVHAIIGVCGNALYYTRSNDGGQTWGPAVNFTSSSGPVGEPRGAKIILDSTGTPVVVWWASVGGSTEVYSARLLN